MARRALIHGGIFLFSYSVLVTNSAVTIGTGLAFLQEVPMPNFYDAPYDCAFQNLFVARETRGVVDIGCQWFLVSAEDGGRDSFGHFNLASEISTHTWFAMAA